MPTIRLPFRRWPIDIDKATRTIYYTNKPVLRVTLNPPGKEKKGPFVPFYALIDTGADATVFPGHVGERLGFDIKKGESKVVSGVKSTFVCYRHRINLTLEYPEKRDFLRPAFAGPAYFSNELVTPWGLIGEDILSQMKMRISIAYKNLVIELTY